MKKTDPHFLLYFPLFIVFLLILTAFFSPFLTSESQMEKLEARKSFTRIIPQKTKLSARLQNKLSVLSDSRETVKIWIYFTDKGISSQAIYEEKKAEVRRALKEHCLWRRKKVRQKDNLIDQADFPLYVPYRQKVKAFVERERTASRWLNAISAEANTSQIQALEKFEFVRKIDLVLSFRRDEIPFIPTNDSERKRQNDLDITYGSSYVQLNQINVPPLHSLGFNGKDVVVGMLDTGFRKSHEIFQHAHILSEWDFVNGDNDVQQNFLDPNDYSDSHGTATLSILGGYKPGELIGPAFGANFILAKTETERFEEPIEEDYWVAGIEWEESLGAEVVSSSLGYIDWYTFEDMDGETAVTTLAANRAVSLGVVVVNAVGNERDDPWGHIIAPSDGSDVLAVGAVNVSGEIASFSSPGPTYDGRIKPEVCALGVNDWIAANSEDGRDTYRRGSGTSFATPLVAGAAALLLEIHRDWTPAQIRSALLSTASRSQNPDNDYGWGIVNATLAASLEFALPSLDSFSIDDDNSGESAGNGNEKVEAGEIIEINITLENEGLVPALSLEATLSSPHPDIKILRPKVYFPKILPLGKEGSKEPFLVKIPPFFLGHHATFRLEMEGANCPTMNETLRISVSR